MIKINVVSPIYKNQKVKFGKFSINFTKEGKGIAILKEEEVEEFNKIFGIYPSIFKGDEVPVEAKKKEEVFNLLKSNTNNNEHFEGFNFLKNKNIELAKKCSDLEKENEILKQENAILRGKKEPFKESEVPEIPQEEEVTESTENVEKTEQTEVEESSDLKTELGKKTVTQLKEILKNDLAEYEEEWKKLSKKADIIDYIVSKADNS